MIDSKKTFEKILQNFRFKKVLPYLKGDVLDFGGNNGELAAYVKGNYTLVNYDHSPMKNKKFDTIVLLAVVEHIEVAEVHQIFKKFKGALQPDGRIFLTTPTPASKSILELLAWLHILDKQNIEEHKHYWNKDDLTFLAQEAGFAIVEYKKFQLGFNQYAILKHQ
jgi:SAM-dependent methyltransferase